MEGKKPRRNSRYVYPLFLAALVLMCLCVVAACFQYYGRLQRTIKAESGDYLQEISNQINVNAGRTIENNFSVLSTVATVLHSADVATFDQLAQLTRDQQQYWDFQRILLVDADGVGYDDHGHATLLGNSSYLRQVIVDRQRAMSTSQMVGGMECVVFAIPVDGLVVGGKEMSALVATYDLSTFDRILSMTAFEGQGYGHIIRKDGTVVVRSSSPHAPETGYNILASLSAAPFAEGSDAETVISDIANGKKGQAELTLGGEPLLMAYTPLETQEWCLLTFVPVAVATQKSTLFLTSTLVIGALIALTFAILTTVLVLTALRHQRKLEHLAYVDSITGGHTMQRFHELGEGLLGGAAGVQYALAYTNLSKFKVLNEQLGRAACDTILRTISQSIQQDLGEDECVGRLFADNFCVLLRYTGEEDLARRLATWNNNYNCNLQKTSNAWLPLTVEIGVYIVADPALPLADMVDRAKLALRETPRKSDAQVRYTIYDEQVRRHILREKQLEDMMAGALAHHEFRVFLQPKYRTVGERIDGAEALVRWESASEGMIYPDEFISLFEKNGFIVRLDLWVFEQVCQTLRGWLDQGRTPVPISVNCSRVHLRTPGFLDRYRDISRQYAVPPELLEIELTETVVFEDVVTLTRVIEEIHALGFRCSMDDFGSGYSSLNLIQDIPVDVLKLDRIFFRCGTGDLSRTESVVGSIITMAQALSMETVAEGVEERAQVDMLERLGCDYIQGYYFARPMPIADFELLAFGSAAASEDA